MDRVNLSEVATRDPVYNFKASGGGGNWTSRIHLRKGRGDSGNAAEIYAYVHPQLGLTVHAVSTGGSVVDLPWHQVTQHVVAEAAATTRKRTAA